MTDDTDEARALVERAAATIHANWGLGPDFSESAQEDAKSSLLSLGISLATLAALAGGRLVAVPREVLELAEADVALRRVRGDDGRPFESMEMRLAAADRLLQAREAYDLAMLAAADGEGGA